MIKDVEPLGWKSALFYLNVWCFFYISIFIVNMVMKDPIYYVMYNELLGMKSLEKTRF